MTLLKTGNAVRIAVQVQFYRAAVREAASCNADTRTPTVRFNTYHLDDEWLQERGQVQIESKFRRGVLR